MLNQIHNSCLAAVNLRSYTKVYQQLRPKNSCTKIITQYLLMIVILSYNLVEYGMQPNQCCQNCFLIIKLIASHKVNIHVTHLILHSTDLYTLNIIGISLTGLEVHRGPSSCTATPLYKREGKAVNTLYTTTVIVYVCANVSIVYMNLEVLYIAQQKCSV